MEKILKFSGYTLSIYSLQHTLVSYFSLSGMPYWTHVYLPGRHSSWLVHKENCCKSGQICFKCSCVVSLVHRKNAGQ